METRSNKKIIHNEKKLARNIEKGIKNKRERKKKIKMKKKKTVKFQETLE